MSSHTKDSRTELYACLCAKEFPAQAMLRHRPELRVRPVAVMHGEPPLQSVCSFNSRARSLGIAHGMTRVEVETFPSVVALPRSIGEEAAAKTAMLECAGAFSPRLEDCSDDRCFLCILDIQGTEKLFGPPKALAQTLISSAGNLGIAATIAVSGSFHAAISLVRGMPSQTRIVIAAPGNEVAMLAPLPLAVLDPSPDHADTFAQWGIRTLGALAALPERELIARLGQHGKRLRQLARGESPHLFVPIEPAFRLEERIDLDTSVELLDSLLFVISMMLEQLILRAAARVLALAELTITLSLEGETQHMRTIRPALPSNDRQLWIKLLHLDLEAHPPHAAVLSLTLTAKPGGIAKVQLGLFSPQLPEPMRLDVTLARIRAIVGDACAGRAVLMDTHRPCAFRMEPFSVPSKSDAATAHAQPRTAARRLCPPERIAIAFHDRQPKTFVFREQQYAIEHAYGPWLLSGDWWHPTLWSREQWDLVAHAQDDALLCCCAVRDPTCNCWYMEALYD